MDKERTAMTMGVSATLSNYYINSFFFNDSEGVLNETQNAMSLEVFFGQAIDGENSTSDLHRVTMNIYVNAGTEEPTAESPCRLGITGEFRTVRDDISEEAVRECLRKRGVDELYAIAKTVMASLTALAPSGVVMLPSVSFDE